jgi:hypothetical protein
MLHTILMTNKAPILAVLRTAMELCGADQVCGPLDKDEPGQLGLWPKIGNMIDVLEKGQRENGISIILSHSEMRTLATALAIVVWKTGSLLDSGSPGSQERMKFSVTWGY